MSFMFGLDSMPYIWQAKSKTNEVGASHLAVETVIPIVAVVRRLEEVSLLLEDEME